MTKKLFDLKDLGQNRSDEGDRKGQADHSLALSTKYLRTHQEKIRGLRDLVGQLPEPGTMYFLWTLKSFNAFTFVPFLLRERGRIDELVISTFAINQRVLTSFMHLVHKGKVDKIHILVSESVKKRLPKVYDQLELYASQYERMTVAYAWNHSKVSLARCGEDYYVMEGSGNWSENAAYEQYILMNNREVWRFRRGCVEG